MGFQSVRCPDCGRDYQIEDRWIPELGAKVRCESCDHLLWIPPPSSENGDMDLLIDLPEPAAKRVRIPPAGEIPELSPKKPPEAPPEPSREAAAGEPPADPVEEPTQEPAKEPDEPPGPVGRPTETPMADPLGILDHKLRTWIAGRDDQIRKALGSGSFFSTFGEEFLEMVEGDPDLTEIEAAVQARAESPQSAAAQGAPHSAPEDGKDSKETPSWLALSRLRKLLLDNGHSSQTKS